MRKTLWGIALAAWLPMLADDTFSPALFWWWNSKLDVKELCAQVDDFYSHGSRTLCIHPFPQGFRPGRFPCDMAPDYLTDGYLDVYAAVTDYAASKGMTCWFYDEGGWPSGGVCGKIMASDPVRFARRWMTLGKDGKPKVVVEKYDPSVVSPYPSVIEPGVTELFLSLTHERIKERIGRHFGKAVPWLFTDEPSTPHGKDRLGWATDFEREFRARKGYDIMPFVPDIIRSQSKATTSDEMRRVRIDYYDILCQLFLERFVLPCRDWCRENGLLYGGHFDGDDDMRCNLTHGHNHLLRCLRAMDLPGVDCIWRQIHPDTDYTPLPRYASSAAHQTGAKRVLSETFAIFGETLSPDIMKRTVDFEMVRGVNQFVFAFACQSTKRNFMSIGDPHLGKPDPKWAFMGSFNEYVRDTCARLAEGTNPVRVAVYYDVGSVWAGGHDAKGEGEAAYRAQIEVAKGLDARQVDFDFVDDEMIEAGRLPYAAVVFPTDGYLSEKGKTALDTFRARGGTTLGPGELDKAPRTCRVAGGGAENIRATKRLRTDGSADYFLVNESGRALELTVAFDEGPELVRAFDPYGSEFVRIGKGGRVEAKPLPKPVLARRLLNRGWTVRKIWSVKPGAEDFEYETNPQTSAVPCELGDWGCHFGTNFSGRAVYRTEFFSASGEAYVDLGKVGVCAEASLNGKKLPPKFFGPFRWAVTLEAGTNVLEVIVGNTLANALIPELERIGREFPPPSSYAFRERAFYEKDDLSSGLIGPVRLDITRVTVPDRPLPSFRPGAVTSARRAELEKEIPESLDAARRWSAELKSRGERELLDGAFQKRRFFKRLELVSNLVANTSLRFRRGTESDFGHAERSLDDLEAFRRCLEKELDLWRDYPENPAAKATSLNVRDFGAVGDGTTVENAAFERALAAVRQQHGRPTVLTVPAGDYLFETTGRANLVLSGLTNFILRGESPEMVRFLCGTYDAESVRIDRCENVTVGGFQNRYLKPTFFQGEVVRADNEKGFIEATLDEGALAPTDPAWTNHYAIIRGSLYHRDGRMDLDWPNAAFEFDADDMGSGKYRIHFSTRFTKRRYGTLKADRKFAIPNRDNRYSAMFFNESTFCNFENVWVRQSRASAFCGIMTRNCSLICCKDIPLDGMVMSSCADSCHYQTGMYLEGCEFRGMGDDGVNTLTCGGFVYARPSADSFVHEMSPALVVPGLLVQFMDPATGEMLGNARIVRSEPCRWRGRACQRVTLDRLVPDGVTTYDDLGRGPLSHRELDQATVRQGKVYETPTHFYIPNAWGVGSVISGCSFSTTRCAGLVLQNSNTLVENCRVRNAKTGFRVNALGSFREGTPSQNVIVRNCSFSDIGEDGAIVFQGLQNTPPTVASMGFLRIEGCAFSGVRRDVLSLNDAGDSAIRGITLDGRPVVPRFRRNAENNDIRELDRKGVSFGVP